MRKILLSVAGLLCLFFIFSFYYVHTSDATGNLLTYWKFDETTAGDTVFDSSGNGFNGTPHNLPQPSTDVPSTITFSDPESLSFNGTTQYVSVPDSPSFAMTSATFSVWVKFTNLGAGDMDMIAKRSSDGSQAQWQFGYNAGGNQFKVSLANGTSGSSCCTDFDWSPSPSLSANTWYNIAVAIDGTHHTLTWYQNGISKTTQDTTGSSLGAEIPADLTLGASYDGNDEFLQGLLDDVRIYNTALTSDQIADIAAGNSGPGIATPTPTPTPPNSPTPPAPTTQPNISTSNSSPMPSAPVCSDQESPGTPNLFQIDADSTQATLYFAPVDKPVSNYYISYGYTPGDERFGTFTDQGSSTGVLSYTVNALSADTTYYFKIRSQNGCRPGNWSNEIALTTPKGTTNVRYFKDLLSQIFSVIPQPTTTLNTSEKPKAITKSNSCTYTVQSGDSLWSIANVKLGTGWDYQKIESENNLNSAVLHPGQSLKIGC